MNWKRTLLGTRLLILAGVVSDVSTAQAAAAEVQNTTVNASALPELSLLESQVFYHQHQLNDIMARLGQLEEQYQQYRNGQCCQLLEPQNVALNRPTSQSTNVTSILGDGVGVASLAVDGISDGEFWHRSCTHTDHHEGKRSWWQVDLQSLYSIKSVTIFNRVDCCPERLNDVYIYIYEKDPTIEEMTPARLCHHYAGAVPAGSNVINCDAGFLRGRYVLIINGVNEVLTLCEVEVFAVPAPSTLS